jgi:hypothetical protein
VMATAAANTTAMMVRTGRMATPPYKHDPDSGPGHQRGLGRSRQGVGRASRQARTRLDEVAIMNRNKHGARAVEALSNS